MKKIKYMLVLAIVMAFCVPLFAGCDKGAHKTCTWVETSITAATCTANAIQNYECTNDNCSKTKQEQILRSFLDHDTSGAAATCETAKICARSECNHVLIAALGHDTSAPDACLTDKVCARENCDEIISEALGHTMGPNATCTLPQLCIRCSELFADALGHNYTVSLGITPPSWGVDGFETFKCVRCTDTKTVINMGSAFIGPSPRINIDRTTLGQVGISLPYGSPIAGDVNRFDAYGYVTANITYTGATVFTNVRFEVEVAENAVQLFAFDGANWYDVGQAGWGPPEGFHISIATAANTKFYVIGLVKGSFEVKMRLIDVISSAVLTESLQRVVVECICVPSTPANVCEDVICTICGELITAGAACVPSVPVNACEDIVCIHCGKFISAGEACTPSGAATCEIPNACTECGTIIEAALGHNESGAAATCTTAKMCVRVGCDYEIEPKLNHNFESLGVTQPTWDVDGYEDFICTRCAEHTRTYDVGSAIIGPAPQINIDQSMLGTVEVSSSYSAIVAGDIDHFNTYGFVTAGINYTGATAFTNVRFEIEVCTENAVQLFAFDGTNWYDTVQTGWGPPVGFPISNGYEADTKFYVVGLAEGTFTVTMKLVCVESGFVLAEMTGNITVVA